MDPILTRSQFFSTLANKPVRAVEVEGYGRFYLRHMTAKEKDAFDIATNPTGKKKDLENIRARLLVRCLADETGNRLLSDGDVEQLGEQMPNLVAEELWEAAIEMNGMAAKDKEAAKKNSGTSPGGSSTSTSVES